MLRRLSVFVGAFTLNAAREVTAGEELDGQQVVRTLAGLVEKSLVAVSGQRRDDALSLA